jgi:hypothetical protein
MDYSTHYKIHIKMKGHITKDLVNGWFYLTDFGIVNKWITVKGRMLSEGNETPIGVKEEIHVVDIDVCGLVRYGYEDMIEEFMKHIMKKLLNEYGLEAINTRTACRYVIEGTRPPHNYIEAADLT